MNEIIIDSRHIRGALGAYNDLLNLCLYHRAVFHITVIKMRQMDNIGHTVHEIVGFLRYAITFPANVT